MAPCGLNSTGGVSVSRQRYCLGDPPGESGVNHQHGTITPAVTVGNSRAVLVSAGIAQVANVKIKPSNQLLTSLLEVMVFSDTVIIYSNS